MRVAVSVTRHFTRPPSCHVTVTRDNPGRQGERDVRGHVTSKGTSRYIMTCGRVLWVGGGRRRGGRGGGMTLVTHTRLITAPLSPLERGGGHSGTEWLPTAIRLGGVEAVNAKSRGGQLLLKARKRSGQLQTENL